MKGMDEEQAEEFEAEIGMRPNPEKDAMEMLRAHQMAAGITFDNPDAPVAPDDKSLAQADDDEELGTWMGGPRRG
jgi:hypothetical protein